MKDCPLCDKEEFTKVDEDMHNNFDMHTTNGLSWKPEKGHHLKEMHDKSLELLKKVDSLNKQLSSLNNKIIQYNNLAWYKKIFTRI